MTLREIYLNKSLFATRIVDNEMILVPVRNNVSDMNEMFTLNEVACFIWEHIDENLSENEIVKALVSEFDIDENTAQHDVAKFILMLEKLITLVSK